MFGTIDLHLVQGSLIVIAASQFPRCVDLNLSFTKDLPECATRGAIEKSDGQFCLLALFVRSSSHLPALPWVGYVSSTFRTFSHASSSINDQTSSFH
jgi:hypothetical protein